ncbi:MAG: hypothetical protein FGM36_14200, partial [Burkholderiaceae bacterium]|nr:hypothetical protein [Burkholderiaceae bacterium]
MHKSDKSPFAAVHLGLEMGSLFFHHIPVQGECIESSRGRCADRQQSDAVHAGKQLDEHEAAQAQVGFADRLLLSKTDLVEADQLNALQERLASMNPRAPQQAVHFGQMPLSAILDI